MTKTCKRDRVLGHYWATRNFVTACTRCYRPYDEVLARSQARSARDDFMAGVAVCLAAGAVIGAFFYLFGPQW